MNIRKKLISAILCLCMILSCSPVSAEEAIPEEQSPDQVELAGSPYSVVICDDAELLDEQGWADVLEMMRSVSEYANVGFLTYPSGGSSQNSAAKAMNWGNATFGSDTRFTVYIIDMTNRHLDIYASQPLSGILTSAAETSIADNVYRYASRGEYSDCAVETFRLITNVLKDEKNTADEFVFRENIRWGMSVNEVIDLETGEYTKTENDNLQLIAYENVPVSKYYGYLGYAFSSDALVFGMYVIEIPDADMPVYLKTALDTIYGESAASSAREVYEILKVVSGDAVDETGVNKDLIYKWTYSDGTRIILAKEGVFMYIMYVSPEFIDNYTEKETEEIVTTGL